MVHLHGRTIRFDSAQHVLMLVITRQSDGFGFKMVPLQSVELSDVRLVSRQHIITEDVNRIEGHRAGPAITQTVSGGDGQRPRRLDPNA